MRRILPALLAAAACLLPAGGPAPAAAAEQAAPTRGLRYPSLTPDGRWVVFDYRGDIWKMPLDGTGHADRLTVHEAQDTLPRVSPDGTQVAFSSRRNGGFDLFVVSIDGGPPRQVTFHSARELLCDWSPDGKSLLFLSNREPSLWQMDLYEVALEGGTPRRITRDGGRDGTYSADGSRIVYARGFNTIYQDNYKGSANYDLYAVDRAGGTPQRLCDTPGSERWPFLSADGAWLYFLAEEQGVANLWRMPAAGGEREQVTRLAGADLQRMLPDAQRRRAVLERAGQLAWLDLEEAGTPLHELPLVVQADERGSGVEVRTITQGGEQVDVSRDGTQVAFALNGDLWLMPGGGGAGRRVTTTPEEEQWPRFSPDGRRLAYSVEVGGQSDVYVLDLASGKATQVTKHKADDFFQCWSPDGTRLAFSSERSGNRDLWSIELASGKELQLTNHPAADDDPAWSPDGRWIAFDSGRDGSQAIFVMPAEGGPARRVTQGSGFFQVPTWSPDGSLLAFEAFQPDSGQSGGLFVASAGGGPSMQVSRDGQAACWTRSGGWIYFHATRDGQEGIWRLPAPQGVLVGERVPFLGRIEVDRREELAQLFDEAWKRLKDGFYDPAMHGVDWDAMRTKYRDMAADAENKDVFYNVVNQMLAELGASHLGISPGGSDENAPTSNRGPATGVLGLELASEPGQDARRIVALTPGGPAQKAGLKVGQRVTAVHGTTLLAGTDLDRVLAGTAGKEVKLAVLDAEGGEATPREVAVRAVPAPALAKAYFEQWRARSETRVKEGSQGRVGYVHLDQMDPDNLARFQQAVARMNADPRNQGMVMDIRENGGGNIHVQLMAILQARPFVRLQPRGAPRMTQPQLYWDKPVVLLVNERSFSDAEVFPWSFRAGALGTTVGVPTPGGVIGTTDVKLSDGSNFRIPRVGWFSLDGQNLENHGFVPDIVVPESSEDRLAGRDPQLDKALEVVMQQVKARYGEAPPPEAKPEPKPEPEAPKAEPRLLGESLLADARVGEWVRYRSQPAQGEASFVKLVLAALEGGKATFRRELESGPALAFELPESLPVAALKAQLEGVGALRASEAVTTQVGGAAQEGVAVTLELQGVEARLLFTAAVPCMGLLRVEVGGQAVLQAVEWGAGEGGTPSGAAPGRATPGAGPR
ncbi:MAG: S41 family peptidase [Planctomycetia bacterium]